MTIAYLLGKMDPCVSPGFVPVPGHTCDEKEHFLLREAHVAWLELFDAAQRDGISLRIISSTRTFDRQKELWENKWSGRTLTQGLNLAEENLPAVERARLILYYSAMPGTSRHHWGTDFDLNSVEDDYFLTGQGRDEYNWLLENAMRFGFGRPYTERGPRRPHGYEEEKWHWSYLPLARLLLRDYLQYVTYDDITGFSGAETAKTLNVIEEFVAGVDELCKFET